VWVIPGLIQVVHEVFIDLEIDLGDEQCPPGGVWGAVRALGRAGRPLFVELLIELKTDKHMADHAIPFDLFGIRLSQTPTQDQVEKGEDADDRKDLPEAEPAQAAFHREILGRGGEIADCGNTLRAESSHPWEVAWILDLEGQPEKGG